MATTQQRSDAAVGRPRANESTNTETDYSVTMPMPPPSWGMGGVPMPPYWLPPPPPDHPFWKSFPFPMPPLPPGSTMPFPPMMYPSAQQAPPQSQPPAASPTNNEGSAWVAPPFPFAFLQQRVNAPPPPAAPRAPSNPVPPRQPPLVPEPRQQPPATHHRAASAPRAAPHATPSQSSDNFEQRGGARTPPRPRIPTDSDGMADAEYEADAYMRRERSPSNIERRQTRSLIRGAAEHFRALREEREMERRQPSKPRTPSAHRYSSNTRQQQADQQQTRERRLALINRHRQNVEEERKKMRRATPTARRSPSATKQVAAATPRVIGRSDNATLKRLVGTRPSLEDALTQGLRPKYSKNGPETTPRAAPATSRVAADSSSFYRSSRNPVAAPAEEYVAGIEDLYRRMRETYMDLQRNPEKFLSFSASASGPSAAPAAAPHNRTPYVPHQVPFPKSTPSAQTMQLKEELAKLEQQWSRLSSLHQTSQQASVTVSAADFGLPRHTQQGDPKDSVVQRLSSMRSSISAGGESESRSRITPQVSGLPNITAEQALERVRTRQRADSRTKR